MILTAQAAGPNAPASPPRKPDAVVRTGLSRHDFTAKTERDVGGDYLLYLPETYGRDKQPLPLILFLHGSGERGKNPNIIAKFGPPKTALKQKGFPFIVLAPQCPANKWWTDADVSDMVMALLDKVCKEYLVDTDRIYLTGMSMGGFGAWDLAQKYPERWAALAVVCGGGNPYLQMRLKHLPTRVFHGAKDRNVPLFMAQQMVGTLRQVGGQVDLKVYPDLAHNVWDVTYDDPKLYEWFLSHRRGKPAPKRRTPTTRPVSSPSPAARK
ncbi:MAG: prolyl oligopeptidase family serine peptidase [Phycisphaerae bacterium]|nr:prolyl oligopeptidase family serine peptidase [Phycisphaerae bacterium]